MVRLVFQTDKLAFEDQEDVLMKKRAFKTSKIRVLLAETSKINKHSHYILSELTDFDYWITDKEPIYRNSTIFWKW